MYRKARDFTCMLALVCCLGVVTESASALEPSGKTVAVVPSAAARGSTGQRILRVQGPIFMGDRVQTGRVGEAQILFRDNTKLVVGPNSLMTIDSFVFNENNTARKISMNAVKGAFRFITGNSRKQAYSIRTPTATVGIRGTRFDLAVRRNGETSVALFEGQARLCARRTGRCVELRGGCSVAVVSPGGGIGPVAAGQQRSARLRALFPFVVSQGRLRRDFRVDSSRCNIRSAAVQPSDREDRSYERVQEAPGASAPAGRDSPTRDSRTDNPSRPDTPSTADSRTDNPSRPETPSTPDTRTDTPSRPDTPSTPTTQTPDTPTTPTPDTPTVSNDTKGGRGHGDDNHVHTGPPGLEGKEEKGNRDRDDRDRDR